MKKIDYHSVILVVNNQTILASGSYTSDLVDVAITSGYFSLEWVITGDGTAKFEALSSLTGVAFHDINTDIAASQTKSTGISGRNMASFTAVPSQLMKIKVTETGAANAVVVSAWLKVMQR